MLSRLFTALLLAALLAAACSGNADQINVVATTGMIADTVKNVGGSHVHVTQLLRTGVDLHSTSATDSDKTALSNAKIIFTNGLGLEAGMSDAFAQVDKNKPIVPLGESIPQDKLIPSANNTPDPHIWQDVSLWEIVTVKIRDELSALDPAHADEYKANAEKVLAQLQELDQYIRDQIKRIPIEQRVLVTTHDAFRYFGRAYSMDVFALQNVNAAQADVQPVLQVIVDRKVRQIFAESTLPQDVLNSLVAGANAQGQAVEIGGKLYSDSTGQPDSSTDSYEGMMRYNVDIIVTTLLGLPAE